LKLLATILVSGIFLCFAAGCGKPAPKSDAELGLTAQQASGRRVFEQYCAACHYAYSSSGLKGPGLRKLFRKEFLPSGLPTNETFVRQTIASGRGMMPEFGDALSEEQLDNLVAYLHTL
jgi:mono/diheme cytochrome c family protein